MKDRDVLRFLRDSRKVEPLGYALELARDTLMTLSEISRLRWEDLDLEDATVRVTGNKTRTLPLGPSLAFMVGWREKHPDAKPGDLVFRRELHCQFARLSHSPKCSAPGMTFKRFRDYFLLRLIETQPSRPTCL